MFELLQLFYLTDAPEEICVMLVPFNKNVTRSIVYPSLAVLWVQGSALEWGVLEYDQV